MKHNRNWKKMAAMTLALALLAGAAGAETLSLDGTVQAGVTVPVYAPIGGTVETVDVEAGMRVGSGETLFTYRTEKTYAAEDGTVTGVFAAAGDDAETVTERYGADLFIEGTIRFSVSSSVSKAYSSADTTFIHAGETVYIVCRTDANRAGTGIVTSVEGSSYSVLVTEGNFIVGDSVTIFRDEAHSDKLRVGRGSIERVSPTAVTATGAVVRVAVKEGDSVKRGDLLLETLSGTFDGYEMTGTEVKAGEAGVITEVSVETGSTVSKGDIVARIAPVSGMRVEASVSADDRNSLKAGDKVSIELEADESQTYEGTVRFVSEVPETDTEETAYKAVIDFTPDENVFVGMAVVVTTAEESDTIPAGD